MPFSSEIKNFRLDCLMDGTEFGNELKQLLKELIDEGVVVAEGGNKK